MSLGEAVAERVELSTAMRDGEDLRFELGPVKLELTLAAVGSRAVPS